MALLFSSLWVTHPADMGFDFIMIMPLLIVLLQLLIYLWMYLFLVGSSVLLSMVVQQLVANLVLSQQEMNTHPSTLPS